MPSTKKKTSSSTPKKRTPSPKKRKSNNITRRAVVTVINDFQVKPYRRTSPLWQRRQTMKSKSPQPQLPQIPSTEIFRIQHHKWKEEQDRVKNVTRKKWMKNIYENRQKGLYTEPDALETHPYYINQQASNFQGSVQQQKEIDDGWATGDVPHFGGRKKRR